MSDDITPDPARPGPTSRAGFTYAEVGATLGGPLPVGYRHLRYRADIGAAAVFGTAAQALLTWRLHRAAGVPMRVSAPRAAVGVRAASVLAGLRAPCEVIWVADEAGRAGFGYGTLVGHPVRGEESFLVEVVEGRVVFGVTAFSTPATWYTRAAGPVLPVLQRAYAGRLARVLRRLCADPHRR